MVWGSPESFFKRPCCSKCGSRIRPPSRSDYAYQLHRRSEYVTGREPFMERLRHAGALLEAAEREGGTILEPRFEPSYRTPLPIQP